MPAGDELFEEVAEWCRSEWGEYPALAEIRRENGDWVFLFRNHSGDQRPATVVRGGYRRLLIQGSDHTFANEFYLPEGLTAQELGDHVARRYGAPTGRESERNKEVDTGSSNKPGGPVAFADLKQCRDFPADVVRKKIEWAFPEPIGEQSAVELRQRYRDKLRTFVRDVRIFDAPIVVRSGEGAGKTSAHVEILAAEAFDDAMRADEIQRFGAFAFRSREQADVKAQELRRAGWQVLSVKPVNAHYEEACTSVGEKPLGRASHDELSPAEMIAQIRTEQPAVFAAMENVRRSIWTDGAKFDGGTTLLTMSHRAAALWPITNLTRAWYHPAFDPDRPDKFRALAEQFILGRIVFDDPEPDDFILIIPDAVYKFIGEQQAMHHQWKHLTKPERVNIYNMIRGDAPRFIDVFEAFDELMRLDLSGLQEIKFDFEAIPFGYGGTDKDIYRKCKDRLYHIGARSWLATTADCLTFLTTEAIVTEVIEKVLSQHKNRRQPLRLNLTEVPGMYPIRVPVHLDPRASADRPTGPRVSALAKEIISENANAIVISDGARDVERVLSFQAAKGRNGLESHDITLIVMNLAPEKYAELNILGQWLGLNDIISLYYQDQIDQAVGRNRGFRHKYQDTQTRVVSSLRLWKKYLMYLDIPEGRTRLYLSEDGAVNARKDKELRVR